MADKTLQDIFTEHNGDKPHGERKHQCQCDNCAAYRESKKPKKNQSGK